MKGNEKCRNCDGLEIKVISNITIRQSAQTYDFLYDINRNYASILYRFRVMARFSSKVADFNPPHLHLSPPVGEVIEFEFRCDLWHQKTRVPTNVRHYLRHPTFSSFDTIPECDEHTDRHTHTHTHNDGICRASISSRGKKTTDLSVTKYLIYIHLYSP